jgi:hypothetical protein
MCTYYTTGYEISNMHSNYIFGFGPSATPSRALTSGLGKISPTRYRIAGESCGLIYVQLEMVIQIIIQILE